MSVRHPSYAARGLTLLEVVLALLLFSLITMFMLSGQADAAEAVSQAEVERDMAELLRLRLDLVTLEFEKYRDGAEGGEFPANISTTLFDEQKELEGRYEGYTWEVEIKEVVGAGAEGNVEIEGGETHEVLFSEEGTGSDTDDPSEDAEMRQPGDVDLMLFIRVTIYPPSYEELPEDEMTAAMRPRSAWTAVHLPPDEEDES